MYYKPGSQAIGLERDGGIAAGIIYEDWNGASIVCHIAIRGRANKQFLLAISEFAFNTCAVHKIIAPVYSSNEKAMTMVRKMGFVKEGILRNAEPNGDIVLWTLTKSQCKYLGERYHGKTCSTTAVT